MSGQIPHHNCKVIRMSVLNSNDTPEYIGPSPYTSFNRRASGTSISPFANEDFEYFHLEDFEDARFNGAFNDAPGVSVGETGETNPPFNLTRVADSVDSDDGSINGRGGNGTSFFSGEVLTFEFSAAELGGLLPTHAGMVWTDIAETIVNNGELFQEAPLPEDLIDNIVFEGFGPNGESLGRSSPFSLGDERVDGTTSEDRFFGVVNAEGISSIRVSTRNGLNLEVDHLQYGFALDEFNLVGGLGNDNLIGGLLDDTLNGAAGNDRLRGRGGSDRLLGGKGNDLIIGGGGNDFLNAGSGNNRLFGDGGNDRLFAGAGFDRANGGSGNDRINGGGGGDVLFGGGGNDNLKGNAGNDTLIGSNGRDVLNGGANNDLLIGGKGNDFIVGGKGRDLFRFNGLREGRDTINGFETRNDRIQISRAGFRSGLSRGILKANQFALGAATRRTDRFIFDRNQLFFDPDGSGARSSILLAKVSGGNITQANIEII